MDRAAELWPELDYPQWRETAITLQLWTQVVGKIRLSLTPWLNHSWQVPLYVSARGLTTGPIPTADKQILELEFDFLAHRLLGRTSRGGETSIDLPGLCVADFYHATLDALREILAEVGDTPASQRVRAELARFLTPDMPFAAMSRYFVRKVWKLVE